MTEGDISSMNTKLDRVMSLFVRERADWICEFCHVDYKADRQNLHWSHYIGRSEFHTRWHPINANAHCMNCHNHLTANPEFHKEWFIKKMNYASYDYLMSYLKDRRERMLKWSVQDKQKMHAHYKDQLEVLRDRRNRGAVGWLNSVIFELH